VVLVNAGSCLGGSLADRFFHSYPRLERTVEFETDGRNSSWPFVNPAGVPPPRHVALPSTILLPARGNLARTVCASAWARSGRPYQLARGRRQ
jgi:hypothetical protein